MLKNLATIFYFFLIFTELYLGNNKIFFGFSLRLTLAFICLVIIIRNPNIRINFKWFLVYIIIYLIFYFISVSLDSSGNISLFFSDMLLSRFLITFIITWTTLILIPKYINFDTFINCLVIVLIINTFVLYLQHSNQALGLLITDFITGVRFIEIDFEKSLAKHNVIYGLVGTVYSGYLIVVLFPLILYKLAKNKNNLIWVLLLCINLYVAFILAQRSCFILILTNLFFYLVFTYFKKRVILKIFLISFSFLIISDNYDGLLSSFILNSGHLGTISDVNRIQLYLNTLNFIADNIFLGGNASFLKLGEVSAHNLFLNAWIRAGIIGFLCVLFIFIKASTVIIEFLKNNSNKNNLESTFAIILFNLLVMSFTHNSGIVTAEVFTFIFLGIILKIRNLNLMRIKY